MHQDDDCNLKYKLYVHWEAKNVYNPLFRDIDFIAVVWNQIHNASQLCQYFCCEPHIFFPLGWIHGFFYTSLRHKAILFIWDLSSLFI